MGIFARRLHLSIFFLMRIKTFIFQFPTPTPQKKIAHPRHFSSSFFSDDNQDIYFSWPKL